MRIQIFLKLAAASPLRTLGERHILKSIISLLSIDEIKQLYHILMVALEDEKGGGCQ